MIFTLALRSLLTHPIRTLVLACGFGLGVGVMAMLLGVGEVILDQARSPDVSGGGDVVIASSTGDLPSARWILSSALSTGGFDTRIAAASPSRRATLYLVNNGRNVPIRANGGIPSLERAIGDPETSSVTSWTDAASDASWSSPDAGTALAALDRFHPIPDVPARAESWAEWLYFNGHAGDHRFYLTFMVGPGRPGGTRRVAGVRLQLDRAGKRTSYSQAHEVNDADILKSAPNLTIGSNSVRLDGMRYRITLDLPVETPAVETPVGPGFSRAKSRITGDLVVEASPGRALPPLEINGAHGWVSGYVVPVMSGRLSGSLTVRDARSADLQVGFDNGTGYHDHNWGFWKDVSWRWGQVQHGDLSFVYGRVHPPADAADPERIPGFLAAIGPDGPVGYATNVSIEEINDPATGHPRTITVRARSSSLDVTMELAIEEALVTKRGGFFRNELDFLQLRAHYRVRGRAGERAIDFTAQGAAETFRGE